MAAHAVVDAGHRPMQGAGDRISLTGITAFGYHGVFDSERRQGQKFVVDVSCLSIFLQRPAMMILETRSTMELWHRRSLPTSSGTR